MKGIELSDIEAGRKCECGGKVIPDFENPITDSENDVLYWNGFCPKCGEKFEVFND